MSIYQELIRALRRNFIASSSSCPALLVFLHKVFQELICWWWWNWVNNLHRCVSTIGATVICLGRWNCINNSHWCVAIDCSVFWVLYIVEFLMMMVLFIFNEKAISIGKSGFIDKYISALIHDVSDISVLVTIELENSPRIIWFINLSFEASFNVKYSCF